LIPTLVNAVLLLVVAFTLGTIFGRRFDALERSIEKLRVEWKADLAELRADIRRAAT
jgi:hypothetical protein